MLSHAQFARVPLMVDILTVCDLMSQLRDGSIYQAVSIQRTLSLGIAKKHYQSWEIDPMNKLFN